MAIPRPPQRALFLGSIGAVFVVIILAAISVSGTRKDRDRVYARHGEMQSQVDGARMERDEIEKKLQAAVKERDDMEGKLQASRKEREAAEASLLEEKKKIEARAVKAEGEAEALKKERDALSAGEGKLKEELKTLGQERSAREAEQSELKALHADFEGWKAESAKLKAASDAAVAGIADVKGRVEAADADLKGGSTKLDASLARSEALTAEVANLAKQLEVANRALAALRDGQATSEGKAGEIVRRLEEALTLLSREKQTGARPDPSAPGAPSRASREKGKVSRLSDLDSSQRESAAAPQRTEATVYSVEGQILIIAAGARDGVQKGWELEIRRGDARIGRAQVSNVKPDMSGARVISTEEGQEFRPGDRVVFPAR